MDTTMKASSDMCQVKPELSLRLCFTGHRLEHLQASGADLDVLSERCRSAIGTATEAFESILNHEDEERDFFIVAPEKVSLNVSLANGGDILAVEAAARENCGLHFFLPFKAAEFVSEQRFDEQETKRFYSYWNPAENSPNPIVNATRTELDLSPMDSESSAYADCGRLMLDHSDVLIALWDGETENGPGGTRDVIREAQRRNLIVLRINLSGSIGIWIPNPNPVDASVDGHFCDSESHYSDLTAEAKLYLEARLRSALLPLSWAQNDDSEHARTDHLTLGPLKWVWHVFDEMDHLARRLIFRSEGARPDTSDQISDFLNEKPRGKTVYSGFHALQSFFGVRGVFWPILDLNENSDRSWRDLSSQARSFGDLDYGDKYFSTIFPLWQRADQLALYYSHVFRTAYILNFILSATAVAIGLLIVFYPESADIYKTKGILVSLELSLISLILVFLFCGTRFRWKDRWLSYRKLAEISRSTRLFLLLGGIPTRVAGGTPSSKNDAWITWIVRSHIGSMSPLNGCLGPEALRQAIRFAVENEIDGQINYHRNNAQRLGILDHRMHMLATCFFIATIAVGLVYLSLLFFGADQTYKSFKPIVTFAGGVLPVCGAAINGIRATGDFRAAASQSLRTADELNVVRALLIAEERLDKPRRNHVSSLMSQCTRIMTNDLRAWSMIYSQRDLGPGIG